MKQTSAVSPFQFMILVIMYAIGSSILLLPRLLAYAATQDAWLAGLCGILAGMLIVLLIGKLADRFPSLNLYEMAERTFGKWAGCILNLLFFGYFYLISANLLREISDFLQIKLMPETPLYALDILFMCAVVYGTRLGFETFARASEIFFPWVLLLFFFLILFVIPDIHPERILPIFERGMKPVLHGAFYMVGVTFSEFVIFLVYSPRLNDPGKMMGCLVKGSLIGTGIVLTVTIFTLLVLGPEITRFHMYPSYALAKKIKVGHFLERIEVLMAGIWFLTIFVKCTICFNASCLCIRHLFRLKTQHFLTFPLGILLINLASIISPDIVYFQQVTQHIWSPYAITMGVIIPLLLWLTALVRKQKSNAPG